MSVAAGTGYLAALLAGRPAAPSGVLGWLNDLRANAVDRVGALTVPTTRDEEWRFTDISPLTAIPFQPATVLQPVAGDDIERFALAECAARLVFVDGIYAPALSFNNTGIVVEPLAGALARHGKLAEQQLNRIVACDNNVFAALNTAFLQDGALLVVPRDVAAAGPVHVLFVTTQKQTASYPRLLVRAEQGGAVTIVEDYVALQDEANFTNAVSEISLADNASVVHVRVQRENAAAFHIANCGVTLARASRYHTVSVALGARISRHNLHVLQTAAGGECVMDGLALIAADQLADTHSCIDHAQPDGMSRQQHKCIVDGAAHAVFNGKVMVRPGAQHTDSAQSSRNLLLTARAHVDTKPQLEIFADDVKCAHGATVGQLDADEVFYLKSRGLSDTVARDLLTYAFGAEIIERIPVPSLKRALEQTVLARTSR